jgi:hypothetical protein
MTICRQITCALLFFVVLFPTFCADEGKKPEVLSYEGSGSSYVRIYKVNGLIERVEEQNCSFDVQPLLIGDGTKHYLIKKTQTVSYVPDVPGRKSTILIELYPAQSPGQKPIYRIEHKADEIELLHSYYSAVIHGCCGMPDYTELCSYDNKILFKSSGPYFHVTVKDSDIEAFIGFAGNDPSKEKPDAGSVGELLLSAPDGVKSRLIFTTKGKAVILAGPDETTLHIIPSNKDDLVSDRNKEFEIASQSGKTTFDAIDGFKVMVQIGLRFSVAVEVKAGSFLVAGKKVKEISID